jgi:tetratricopeptide (TPR) repeat protein
VIRFSFCAGLLAIALGASAAQASTAVLGSSYARGCFDAATKNQDAREALRLCDGALLDQALSVDDRAATFINRGIIHMQSKQYDAAIADYDAAIALRPDAAEGYINKGIALVRQGNRDREAVAALSAGIDKGPMKPEIAYFMRGIANESLGRTRDAYEDYSRAAQLAPEWGVPAAELERFQTVRRKTAGV